MGLSQRPAFPIQKIPKQAPLRLQPAYAFKDIIITVKHVFLVLQAPFFCPQQQRAPFVLQDYTQAL